MKPLICLRTGLLLIAATLTSQAGSFNNNFDTGDLPAGTHTNANAAGGAYLELTGGVGNSGCLKVTKNINGQNGSFILDDLDAGLPIYGFDATFKMRIGGGSGTPADGISLCVAPDLADNQLFGEGGAGSGLRFAWRVYAASGQTPPDPAIRVLGGAAGTTLAWKGYNFAGISTSGDVTTWWTDVHIHVSADGALTMDYKGANVLTNFYIPGYQDFANAGVPMRFGFGARTGGENCNFWIDDLKITTYTTSLVGISQQPFSQTAQQGDTIAFDVRVANTTGVTYQWYSNNVAIPGAISQTLTLENVQAAASGSKYKVIATGPNNAATSDEVTLTVVNLALPATPQLSFNFNEGTGVPPTGVALTGTAIVDLTGGVADSGCVKLVNPSGSATMLVADSSPTSPIYGFTARFKLLVGGGTVPPADGFVFAFGSDIPDAPSGDFESGVGLGNGLRVTYDIYNNDGIFGFRQYEDTPAPSIDVRYGSQVLGTVQLPISFMESGLNPDTTPAYTDVIVQLNPDGTINVVYHGALVFDRLPVPMFAAMPQSTNTTGSRFAFAARTGGLNDNIWLDNFELTTVTTPGDVRITAQTGNQTILIGHNLTNSVTVNDTAGVTYQWYRGGTAITGATDSSYVLPTVALADSGAVFTVEATKAGIKVTSMPATLTVCDLTPPATPNLTFSFDDGLVPAGTATYGNNNAGGGPGGFITTTGGVGGSGVLHLTDNVNGQSGTFVISNLFGGAQVSALAAAWDVRLGGGTANFADGWSFNFANNLPASAPFDSEQGEGNNLSVCWDLYGNWTDSSPAPAVNIKYKGKIIASALYNKADIQTGDAFLKVLLRVDTDGKLYMSYGEKVLFNGLQLPNYSFISAGQYGFYARTGGQNLNQWIDNVVIQATKSAGPLTITAQPADVTVVGGKTATFTVGVSDPNGVTYQWFKNNTSIGGATSSSYTTPATTTADNGALFKVTATGPSGSATSTNAVLTVIAPVTMGTPTIAYTFNDCLQPDGTTLYGTGEGFGVGGYIDCYTGVTNSGCIHLADAAQGEHGTFIIPDLNTNQPVKAFTVYFAALLGGAGTTDPPADGISFSTTSSNSVAGNPSIGEDGIGNDGLRVWFTLFGGGNPFYRITYKGNDVVTKYVPAAQMVTGNDWADTYIRVTETGKVDVQFNGKVIFDQVQLPNYTPATGFVYVFAGRTGGLWINEWIDNVAIETTGGVNAIPIGYTKTANSLTLTWDGTAFKLQSTPSLSPANWTDVPGATSGYTVPTTTGAAFYRLAPLP